MHTCECISTYAQLYPLHVVYGTITGVYKPVWWNSKSRSLAAFSTFVASGLIHEYVGYLLYFNTSAEERGGKDFCSTCHVEVVIGKQFIFFSWNGLLMLLEYKFGSQLAILNDYLPRLVRNHLVVLLALPLGYLLTDDMTASGYFHHFNPALPILKVSSVPESS